MIGAQEGAAGRIRAALARTLPPEIAEVLLPCLRLRVGAGRLLVALPNRIWLDAVRAVAMESLGAAAAAEGLDLRLAAREEGAGTQARTLATFIEDPGNRLALAACRRVVSAPGLEHNPLYIHGPPGSGKSHLIEGVAAEFRAAAGEEGAVLFTGDEFVARWAQALAGRGDHPLRRAVEGAALVACDGVDALADRTLAQESFFSLINECLDQGRQVVVVGRHPPHHLSGFEDRLTTRLGWGLPVAVEVPLIETRLAVLCSICPAAADVEAAELARWVEHFAPDMHQLVRLAERLGLGERPEGDGDQASFDRILQLVAERYGVRPGDLAGKSRIRQIARARQAALLLGRRLTPHSLQALGGMVGGRDHATVLYAIRQAEERSESDADFAREIVELTRGILAVR